MSATISLPAPAARNINAASSLLQLGLMIAGLFLALVFFNAFAGKALVNEVLTAESTESDEFSEFSEFGKPDSADQAAADFIEQPDDQAETLTPSMRGALDYVTRRYRVSQKALMPIFEAAQSTGREHGLDPLLIVAVIGIESGFNPLAESSMGAQGLMQVIPRFHKDKLPDGSVRRPGHNPFLDPVTNVQVGVQVLQESIRRRGSLIAGLQQYAGSSDADGAYASKVLAEKRRLEQTARRVVVAGT
jgi:soluble lytic murein transglycosylase-like protein